MLNYILKCCNNKIPNFHFSWYRAQKYNFKKKHFNIKQMQKIAQHLIFGKQK